MIFVPSSKGGKLTEMIKEAEQDLALETGCKMKFFKKSCTPLCMMFRPHFPNINGCVLGEHCRVCENDGLKCGHRNITYKAWCVDCLEDVEGKKNIDNAQGVETEILTPPLPDTMTSKREKEVPTYIGETSRPMRARVQEHWNNYTNFKENSFMMLHWLNKHGTSLIPPNFEFKQINKYRDSLSRQIGEAVWIISEGTLKNKNEFGITHLCRLVDDKENWEKEQDHIESEKKKKKEKSDLREFIKLIKNVRENCPNVISNNTSVNSSCNKNNMESFCYRSNTTLEAVTSRKRKRAQISATPTSHTTESNRSMTSSTPLDHRVAPSVINEEDSPIPSVVEPKEQLVSWELLPGDIESLSLDPAVPSQTGNSRDFDKLKLTPTGRAETSQDFEAGANTFMDLATARNILHMSLPANLNNLGQRVAGVDGLNDEVMRMLERLNLESWSEWSGNNSSSSPDRVKRLESFLLEWNANTESDIVSNVSVGSAGSISEVLIVKDMKRGHTVSNIPDKNSEKKKDGIEMEFKCVDKIKKKLIFGRDAPLHLLQQPATPQACRIKKRKLESELPASEKKRKLEKSKNQGFSPSNCDENTLTRNKSTTLPILGAKTIKTSTGDVHKSKNRRKKKVSVPAGQPLIKSALEKVPRTSTDLVAGDTLLDQNESLSLIGTMGDEKEKDCGRKVTRRANSEMDGIVGEGKEKKRESLGRE